ncbi:MAG: hypothetical protein JXA07_12400, partial [Spirochaetes bacterium]|nr:hypothetical protein [Spirochaetota bacterium]
LHCNVFLISCSLYPITGYFCHSSFRGSVHIPILVPYYILLSISIGFIKNKYASTILIIMLISIISIGSYNKLNWEKKEPWAEITNTLIENSNVNTAILLLPNSIRIPIEIYDNEHFLSDIVKSLPTEYPAIGVSKFYPGGTPSVPGITYDNISHIYQLIKDKNKVLLLTRAESLYDPYNITRQTIKEKYFLTKELKWDGITLAIYDKL